MEDGGLRSGIATTSWFGVNMMVLCFALSKLAGVSVSGQSVGVRGGGGLFSSVLLMDAAAAVG